MGAGLWRYLQREGPQVIQMYKSAHNPTCRDFVLCLSVGFQAYATYARSLREAAQASPFVFVQSPRIIAGCCSLLLNPDISAKFQGPRDTSAK